VWQTTLTVCGIGAAGELFGKVTSDFNYGH
jgi:hypothetical protein